jgi:hypothetical protein
MSGRKFFYTALTAGIVAIALLFRFYGSERTWQLWNIPTLQSTFADLRILPAASASLEAGLDPYIENPHDAHQRPFNLPPAWKLLLGKRMKDEAVSALAGFLTLSFLCGLLPFTSRIKLPAAIFLLSATFSPVVMLAIERGNVELFIFFLCALAITLADSRPILASVTLILAAFLKIFPLFGVALFLSQVKGRFLKLSGIILSIFIIYALLTFNDFRHSLTDTEKGGDLSYGYNVIPLRVELALGPFQQTRVISVAASLIAFGLFYAALRQSSKAATFLHTEPRYLTAFRLAASIYTGTFFLGNNWDYRFIFLLFAVPQLVEWAAAATVQVSLPARIALAASLVSLWYLIITRLLSLVPFAAYLLDEAANWALFYLLSYLLFASMPDWVKSEVQASFQPKSLKQAKPL